MRRVLSASFSSLSARCCFLCARVSFSFSRRCRRSSPHRRAVQRTTTVGYRLALIPKRSSYFLVLQPSSLAVVRTRGCWSTTTHTTSSTRRARIARLSSIHPLTLPRGNNVEVSKASNIAGPWPSSGTVVYTPPSSFGDVWAPELHQINGTCSRMRPAAAR
jgi:hypothetical protein